MLAEKAAAYASTSHRGLFHFVRYIEKLKKYDTDLGSIWEMKEIQCVL